MMHIPPLFAQDQRDALHALIEALPFATLISPDAEDPLVTHLPVLLDRANGEHGMLIGHMSRANAHWRHLQQSPQALVIFHGPHAYVSPSWYEHHPSVPSWNYAVVHAHGPVRLLHDAPDVSRILARTVAQFEGSRPQPWRMDLPEAYQARMVAGVVGFEIPIIRLVGKFKLSQNRAASDRTLVIEALEAQGGAPAELAALMRSQTPAQD